MAFPADRPAGTGDAPVAGENKNAHSLHHAARSEIPVPAAGRLYDRSDRNGVRKHLHRSGVCADAGADVKGIRFGQPVVRFPAAL